jgi:hypothetical protein
MFESNDSKAKKGIRKEFLFFVSLSVIMALLLYFDIIE